MIKVTSYQDYIIQGRSENNFLFLKNVSYICLLSEQSYGEKTPPEANEVENLKNK